LKLAYLLNNSFFDINSEKINSGIRLTLNNLSEQNKKNFIDALANPSRSSEFGLYTKKLLLYSSPVFEQVDVSYYVSFGLYLNYNNENNHHGWTTFGRKNMSYIWIEIKPTVSDDFPAILRQMKASMPVKNNGSGDNYFILLVREYTGIGATKEEFIEYFKSQGYLVIFENHIENITLPDYEIELRLDTDIENVIMNNTVSNK